MMDIKRLAIIALLAWVMVLLIPILTPFLLAGLLAYLGDPMVERLHAWHVPRTVGVLMVFLLVILIVSGLSILFVPIIEAQFQLFTTKLPAMIAWLQTSFLDWLRQYVDVDVVSMETVQTQVTSALPKLGEITQQIVQAISYSGLAVLGVVINFFLVVVVSFYLMRDWNKLLDVVENALPAKYRDTIIHLAKSSDEVLGSFLRGQLLVMLALAIIYSVGLSVLGLDVAFIIGVTAGLISVVPYLGTITGFLLAIVAALFQFKTGISVVWVSLIFGFGQLAEGMVLTPLLVGDRIGLHPVAVIFSVMAGGALFGFFGVLLALPVAAVIMVIARYFYKQYLKSNVYSGGAA